jgi:FAD/FMN-containing dehydrogenase
MRSFLNLSDDILAPTMAPAQVQLSWKSIGMPVAQMDKRSFLLGTAAIALQSAFGCDALASAALPTSVRRRVRPGEAGWPSERQWEALGNSIGGRLARVKSTLEPCFAAPRGEKCAEIFHGLKNPYFIGDDYSLTQTCGWLNAWTAKPSAYVVEAESPSDVSAAVKFATRHDLRLVVRGGGHSYLGTSSAPDSLMVWTRRLNDISVVDAFVPSGSPESTKPVSAVSVGAGALWIHVYDKVTTRYGRYVQGGGCATVGVGGLILGGGFGSYSKKYGTAAASLLEAEVVTADGEIRIANPWRNADLFWALKGGGGGTFGVVTRLTLLTHPLPETFGFVSLTVRAKSAEAFRTLIARWLRFYAEDLNNEHWGEIANFAPSGTFDVSMSFQDLSEEQARELWRPFIDWVSSEATDFVVLVAPSFLAIPAQMRWDIQAIERFKPEAIQADDRPNAPKDNVFWAANASEAGHFIHNYASMWLPKSLLDPMTIDRLADRLVAAASYSKVEVHFQKGMAGGSQSAIEAVSSTSMNPQVINAFALAIAGSEEGPAFPRMAGHEPDLKAALAAARRVSFAMAELKAAAPDTGSYVAESNYFEPHWQRSYWGSNYPRLLQIKRKYDPQCLFYVHHGVGTEQWREGGFDTA